ncbi:MAG: response regulator [Pseudomonadales bacterium]|nr:response regulator [Pseudomonadales bacterium]
MTRFTWLRAWFCLLFVQLFAVHASASFIHTPVDLPVGSSDLSEGEFYLADPANLPALQTHEDFREQLKPVEKIDLKGGAFWFHTRVRNVTDIAEWVVLPNGSYIEYIKIFAFGNDQAQRGDSGQNHVNNHLLNYGVDVQLLPGKTYDIWVLLDSRYYSNTPIIQVMDQQTHRDMMFRDTLLVIGCLGGIIILALYNLLIYFWTRERSYLYYSLYLVSTFFGWCGVFGLFNQMFGVIKVNYMMLPFYINIITNTFFYQRFLNLKEHSPRLSMFGNAIAWVCFVMIFVSFLFPHWVRYLFISILNFLWLSTGLIAGIKCLKLGYKPARFFILGFAIVFVGGSTIILPYLGGPRFVADEYMIALVAQTLDVMFLALALADRINVLRKEKQEALEKALAADQLSNRVLKEANDKLLDALRISEENQRSKDAFILSVSHELRTPLNAIGASLDQLRNAKAEDFHELHQYIQFGVDRLSAQVENILMLAETDQREVEPHTREFSIGVILDRIKESNQSYLYQKDVSLSIEIASDVPNTLKGDDHLLASMIAPVVDNACKYTDKGVVQISVGVDEVDRDRKKGLLIISVKDTGPGISPEVQSKIYEPFVQASTGYERTHEGLGLGLSISQRISKILGAELELLSEEGQGSCFSFEVPVELAKERQVVRYGGKTKVTQDADASAEAANESLEELPTAHALVVEDNTVNAKVLGALLNKLGLTMDLAVNGKDAIEMPDLHRYDVIFMDLQMPVMDGFTSTSHLRQQGINCPIIAVTANTDYQARIKCWDVGMNDFLGKPVRKELLQHTLNRWLKCAS